MAEERKEGMRKVHSLRFYRCDYCKKYYTDEEIMINYKGYKIKGCPSCLMIDGLKPVTEEEYLKEHTMEGVRKVPFRKP